MEQKFSLRTARMFRNITQQEMADKLGVHCNTYADWETDKCICCILYGCSIYFCWSHFLSRFYKKYIET